MNNSPKLHAIETIQDKNEFLDFIRFSDLEFEEGQMIELFNGVVKNQKKFLFIEKIFPTSNKHEIELFENSYYMDFQIDNSNGNFILEPEALNNWMDIYYKVYDISANKIVIFNHRYFLYGLYENYKLTKNVQQTPQQQPPNPFYI